MATYREIKGTDVTYESSAPGATVDTGHVWYATDVSKLQSYLAAGSWATTSPMLEVNDRKNYGANGTQNAFWVTNTGAPGLGTNEYNGTGWTSSGAIATGRPTQNGGFGTLTAGANFGGHPGLTTGDTYDGSTWTASPAALTNGRWDASACGTQTAGLMIGGADSPGGGGSMTEVEEFSGSAWTAGGAIPTATQEGTCAGIQTAAVFMGGSQDTQPTAVATSYDYDGEAWTASGALPAAVRYAAAFGTQSSAVNVGGYAPAAVTTTNLYDGSTWSTGSAYPTAQSLFAGGAGSGTAGTMAGGETPAATAAANEYNFDASTYVLDAWASSQILSNARSGQQMGQSIGTSTATFVVGGDVTPSPPYYTDKTEEWDGSSWTAGGTTPGPSYFGTAGGTQTAAWSSVGGTSASPTLRTLDYDGSSWTAAGAAATTRVYTSGDGPQTAGIMAGGWAPGKVTATEEYNTPTWATGGALTQGTWRNSIVGNSGAALGMGGYSGPPGDYAYSTFVGTYDGEAWTTSPMTMLYGGTAGAGICGGSQTAGILSACYSTSPPVYPRTNSQTWDGTSFATGASMNNILQSGSGAGDSTGALAIGGYSPTTTNRTDLVEEYSTATTTTSAKSITTS